VGIGLVTTEHNGQVLRTLGAYKSFQFNQVTFPHLLVEKDLGIERLILRAGTDPALDGQMIQESLHLRGDCLLRWLILTNRE